MVICVTNRALCKENFLLRFTAICKAKPKFIILREKDLDQTAYHTLAKQCLAICNTYGINLVLHTHISTARALGVYAIHLPLHILQREYTNIQDFTTIGTSIHTINEVTLAEQLGATYLIAGHIFSTDCKAGLPPRGIPFLKTVLQSAHVPVYPIGGIHTDTAQEVVDAGATDFCVMSELMICDQVHRKIEIYNQVKMDGKHLSGNQ